MTQDELLECISFFNRLSIHVTDITTDADKANGNKVVETEYVLDGKKYKTLPLYYKEISDLENVRDIEKLHTYFGGNVFWLDIDRHDWPKGSGESDLDRLVVEDMLEDGNDSFRSLLHQLANNEQTGFIQRITSDGRPGQYYHNLENNNHWHDLVLFIKEVIAQKGNPIDKRFFQHLIFNWDKGKRTSLNAGTPYKIVSSLYLNIQSIQTTMDFTKTLSLLRYKKQIILQGPPGTGKTKLAKELANVLARPKSITSTDIKRILKIGQTIISISDHIPYTITSITDTGVVLTLANGSSQARNYNHIIQAYTNLLAGKSLTGGDAYQAAIAKFIMDQWHDSNYLKLVQFHPSYSYEDFVRGIVAESKGDKIEYKNVNKTLGQFAKDALENYDLSKTENKEAQIGKWIDENFSEFKDEVENAVEQGEVILSGTIGVFEVDSNCFRYGKEWRTASRINFNDFKILIASVVKGSLKPEQSGISKEISVHAHYRSTYYTALLRLFFEKHQFVVSTERPAQRNYVLIIDEINRANLSSVLGELIYALEYRGEKVESIYNVDDKSELVLPPNLYIIGTMNTADRSVGHIDYAIRRRFAFVDVQPKDLSIEIGDKFHKDLYEKVGVLFQTNLSDEFKVKDVQLGHSYFIDKTADGGSMDIRLKYEIVPILQEYVKDGILIGRVNEMPIHDYIESLSV